MSLKHMGEIFLAPKYLAPCQPFVTIIILSLFATLLATAQIICRSSGEVLPTSEAFSLTGL